MRECNFRLLEEFRADCRFSFHVPVGSDYSGVSPIIFFVKCTQKGLYLITAIQGMPFSDFSTWFIFIALVTTCHKTIKT